jgi:hypothetical protein
MQKHPIILLSIALFIFSGCIERYYPDEEELKTGTVVVVAHLNNLPGKQSVYLSRSTTLQYPEYNPLSGCYVELMASDGTVREFHESEAGEYSCHLDEQFLRIGEEYCLIFITPDGERYESEFEKVYPAPGIDSLYYVREDQPTPDPGIVEEGIRFYLDFEIDKDSSKYLRWHLTETYEIHNPEYSMQIFDVDRQLKRLPDSLSWSTCWISLDITDIYTKDLSEVEGDLYKMNPLNFVSSGTRRLHYKYSLLVRQMALSKEAFWYWDELAKNLQSKGNLFDTQPSLTPSNICNVNDEEELVIGYFSISGATERRISVEEISGLNVNRNELYCDIGEWPRFLWYFRTEYLPVYLATSTINAVRKSGEINKECADCREYKGSSNMKPEFW